MKLKNFNEEFLTSTRGKYGRKEPIEVYVNPTYRDFIEASPQKPHEVRFVAVGKQNKVYIFDAAVAIHSEVTPVLGISGEWAETFNYKNKVLLGTAKQVGDKWVMNGSDSVLYWINYYPEIETWQKSYLHMFYEEDWSWVNKYIDVNLEVSKYKKAYAQAAKDEMSEHSIVRAVRIMEYEKSRSL
jgi:hypothetical protein